MIINICTTNARWDDDGKRHRVMAIKLVYADQRGGTLWVPVWRREWAT